MSDYTEQLKNLIENEIAGQIQLFDSLWKLHQEPGNTLAPHRQRTAVNRLMGYALFMGVDRKDQSDLGKNLSDLRKWQKRLGDLRDLDVTRKCLSQAAKINEDASYAETTLDERLAERRQSFEENVRWDASGALGADTRIAMRELAINMRKLVSKKIDKVDLDFLRKSVKQVAVPWFEFREQLRYDQTDAALHAFRVRNKKLRFVLEIIVKIEDFEKSEHIEEYTQTVSDAHDTIGNLSDYLELEKEIRLAMSEWSKKNNPELMESALALRQAKLELEQKEIAHWYRDLWPVVSSSNFLTELL